MDVACIDFLDTPYPKVHEKRNAEPCTSKINGWKMKK
jgi:hypothetical protein